MAVELEPTTSTAAYLSSNSNYVIKVYSNSTYGWGYLNWASGFADVRKYPSEYNGTLVYFEDLQYIAGNDDLSYEVYSIYNCYINFGTPESPWYLGKNSATYNNREGFWTTSDKSQAQLVSIRYSPLQGGTSNLTIRKDSYSGTKLGSKHLSTSKIFYGLKFDNSYGFNDWTLEYKGENGYYPSTTDDSQSIMYMNEEYSKIMFMGEEMKLA